MEVRLLSVGTRGFFLAASRLAIAAQFCRPQREKNLWRQGKELIERLTILVITREKKKRKCVSSEITRLLGYLLSL